MSLAIEKAKIIIRCNFCGEDGKRLLVAGLYGYICSSCVSECVEILISNIEAHGDMDGKNES
ncbi:ClpX C4-type zinc finger protein [Xenorhabdus bovienii]